MRAAELPPRRPHDTDDAWSDLRVPRARHLRPAVGADLGALPRRGDGAAQGTSLVRAVTASKRMTTRNSRRRTGALALATIVLAGAGSAAAHHSFAMYDIGKTYVLTGVVTRVDPNPNHLQLFFVPLNDARDQIVKNAKGEPVVWAVEMEAAGGAARQGVTVNNFPRGTIISVGLHPHRNGFSAGGRGTSGL